MSRVHEMFDDIRDFETLLRDAEAQAKSEWAQEFVSDINAKYEQYGADMYLSEKQREKLEDIVG